MADSAGGSGPASAKAKRGKKKKDKSARAVEIKQEEEFGVGVVEEGPSSQPAADIDASVPSPVQVSATIDTSNGNHSTSTSIISAERGEERVVDSPAELAPQPTELPPSSAVFVATEEDDPALNIDDNNGQLNSDNEPETEELNDSEERRLKREAKGKGPAPSSASLEQGADKEHSPIYVGEEEAEDDEQHSPIDRTPHALVIHSRKLSSGSLVRQVSGEAASLLLSPEESKPRSKAGRRKADESVNEPGWAAHKKHFFVLSSAGKPIYSRYGDESALAPFAAVVGTIVAFFADEGDAIRSLQAGDVRFVFLLRWPLYLLCVSRTGETEGQLRDQLRALHSQFVSLLTGTQLQRIFEQRPGYDLRGMLGGAENQLVNLPKMMNNQAGHSVGAIRALRMQAALRQRIGGAMAAATRPKSLVFAVLLAEGKLVTLVRPRRHSMNPSDLLLLLNLVFSNPSFRTPTSGESWTPVCLPRFNPRGFLHAYLAPLAEGITLCVLGTEREAFWEMHEWKESVVSSFQERGMLQALQQASDADPYPLHTTSIPHVRHFIYKSRTLVQFTEPAPAEPYADPHSRRRLIRLYSSLLRHTRPPVHATTGPSLPPATVVHKRFASEAVAGYATGTHEVYVACSPFASGKEVLEALEGVKKWGKKFEDECFVLGAPTF